MEQLNEEKLWLLELDVSAVSFVAAKVGRGAVVTTADGQPVAVDQRTGTFRIATETAVGKKVKLSITEDGVREERSFVARARIASASARAVARSARVSPRASRAADAHTP